MDNEELPQLPCEFTGGSFSPTLRFYETKIVALFNSDGCDLGGEIAYLDIRDVKVKLTKSFMCIDVGDSFLELYGPLNVEDLPHSYFASQPATSRPVRCPISAIDRAQWPVILKLIQRHAPQADFDACADEIINSQMGT